MPPSFQTDPDRLGHHTNADFYTIIKKIAPHVYGILRLTWASVDLRLVGGVGHRYMFVHVVIHYFEILKLFPSLFLHLFVKECCKRTYCQHYLKTIIKITENKQSIFEL